VPYGRSRSSFGKRPKTFWDRMESLLKKVDVANAEDVEFEEIEKEDGDDDSEKSETDEESPDNDE
jgi:hypothetical protein